MGIQSGSGSTVTETTIGSVPTTNSGYEIFFFFFLPKVSSLITIKFKSDISTSNSVSWTISAMVIETAYYTIVSATLAEIKPFALISGSSFG